VEAAVLQRLLEIALHKGGDYADIYIENKKSSGVWFEDSRLEKSHCGVEGGAGIRLLKGRQTAYVYTSDLTLGALEKAARLAAQALRSSEQSAEAIPLLHSPVRHSPGGEIQSNEVSWEHKMERVFAADQAARSLGQAVRQVSVGLADLEKAVVFANSLGERVEDSYNRIRGMINVVAARDGILQTGYESLGGVCGWELLDDGLWEERARKAAQLAVSMLSARPAPAGRMAVIMSSEAGGTMIHEACGHGLEADLVQKQLSVYQGRRGEMVASPLVTVIDDPTLDKRYGSYVFDDEGTAAQRTVLIEAGRLVNYLYDRHTALADRTSSTGNGRRESYQHKPIPRMSNTYIAPGQDHSQDIIASTPRGLLVMKMGGGQVNTLNGDFVFEVSEAYMIEDGKVSYPVRGATLTGNGPRALQDVDRIGNDLGFSIGVCGKDGQGVPVSDAQPTIRIKELTVGGTQLKGKTAAGR
jgi:TldD protein